MAQNDFLYYQYHSKLAVPENLSGEVFSGKEKLTYLDHINKVNLFIGANNSGKSKIIREILKDKNPGIGWSKEVIRKIEVAVGIAKEKVKQILKDAGLAPDSFSIQPFQQDNFLNSKILFEEKLSYNYSQFNPNLNAIKGALILPSAQNLSTHQNSISVKNASNYQHLFPHMIAALINKIEHVFSDLNEKLNQFEPPIWKPVKIYIPAIRTLRDLASHNALKVHVEQKYKFEKGTLIESGEDFYDFVIDHKNARPEKEKRLIDFEKFLSKTFFSEQTVKLKYYEEDRRKTENRDKTIYIKIGDQKEFPVYDLGDGLQMIIILTFPFFQNDCGIVAIEEPELFIHPGLQRKLLDFLVNNAKTKNFQIFIASHSNHFIDAVNESELVSIFTVSKCHKDNDDSDEKLPDFVIENVAYGSQDPLHLLGVNNSSVCLANCTIWIEGVTDKLYLSKYLKEFTDNPEFPDELKSFKKYQEGVHYSFVLSAGDNIIHWDFDDAAEYEELSSSVIVKNLCGKAFVIIDDDFTKHPVRKEFLDKILGKNLLVLSVPEIENLLSLEVIVDAIAEYPSLKDLDTVALKSKDRSQVESLKLGTFIDKVLLDGVSNGKRFSASKSASERGATINDKISFCKKAVNHIALDNMTQKSKDVAEKIIRFVIEQNSNRI